MNASRISAAATLAVTTALVAPTAMAHHSIAGEFDQATSFELRGTLTQLDWTNPHLWYYLDVVDANGKTEQWQCTTGINPNRLLRSGWNKEDLPVGSKIVFTNANPSRDKTNTCYTGGLTLEDGTPIFSGRRGT
jgi:hypothetical protein